MFNQIKTMKFCTATDKNRICIYIWFAVNNRFHIFNCRKCLIKETAMTVSTYKSSVDINSRFKPFRKHDLKEMRSLFRLPALAKHHQQFCICLASWFIPALLSKKCKNLKRGLPTTAFDGII
ncbi:hypothetical protein V8G54_035762 [Vigna mungo]|uniref:Uncharacterized protein n=1 Tax=Vigna mungo TaxID=3915 RepID=A0AAQ3MGF6_VIGMU